MPRRNLMSSNNLIELPPPQKLYTPYLMRYQLNGYKHRTTTSKGYKVEATQSFTSLFAKLVDVRLFFV